MKRVALLFIAVLICGSTLSGLASPARPSSHSIRTTRDAIAACERRAFDSDGNNTAAYEMSSSTDKELLSNSEWACDFFLRETEAKYCTYLPRDALRRALLTAARSPVLARLPLETFVQNVLVTQPGCSLRTCPSSRMTYRSKDGLREFLVTATGRGTYTQPFAGGNLTKELMVLKGSIGTKTAYVYLEAIIKNTGNQSAGTQPPTLASERLAPSPYNLAWRSWPEHFQSSKDAFAVHGTTEALPEMKGLWTNGECRGGATCPPGWGDQCEGP